MKSYRDLFQREFADISPAGDRRIRDIAGSGLPLGLETYTLSAAIAVLAAGTAAGDGGLHVKAENRGRVTPEQVSACIQEELASLIRLRSILTGAATANPEEMETLLDSGDYLWAHFPDCAGAEGRRPPVSDLGFLKRVRAEIDPFMKLLSARPARQRPPPPQ
jgi:hypothetical protein